jgi:hypothetical protein
MRYREVSSSEENESEECPSSNVPTAGDEEEHDPLKKLLI